MSARPSWKAASAATVSEASALGAPSTQPSAISDSTKGKRSLRVSVTNLRLRVSGQQLVRPVSPASFPDDRATVAPMSEVLLDGRYRLGARLGAGGMGVVDEAL